ncbi:MAG: hypothetical protein A2Y41_00710 [Spirochaetes bacterium GWB1_36_13]|nr:MAG: hypothetical protein A2Y41_00710 [Spirochaetes bacterium GWB1_36_13]
MSCGCSSEKKATLIYACSGAANTGAAADQTARLLARQRFGAMTCLAALGADLSGFIESAKSTDENLILDGCPVACGKKIFDKLGIKNYKQVLMTELGMQKGATPVNEELIQELAKKIKEA